MVTQTKEAPTGSEQKKTSGVLQTIEKDVKPLQTFWTKFNNDWMMNFSAGLAFNLITAIVPIIIAIISIVGFIFGWLNPTVKVDLINHIHAHEISSSRT